MYGLYYQATRLDHLIAMYAIITNQEGKHSLNVKEERTTCIWDTPKN
jgi:hypothetical protein